MFEELRAFYINYNATLARTSIGASALPKGAEFYQAQISYYTTTNSTAEQIHQLGLDEVLSSSIIPFLFSLPEVARIKARMTEIATKNNMTLDNFLTFLRTDPRFYAKTEAELLAYIRNVAKKVDAQLPLFFRYSSFLHSLSLQFPLIFPQPSPPLPLRCRSHPSH